MRIMPGIFKPVSGLKDCSRTVQLFTFDFDNQKILLVHEKGDEKTGAKGPGPDVKIRKLAGSGMPGGGIDENKSEHYLAECIQKSLLPIYRISGTSFREMPCDAEMELKLFLTAVTEGIEETGLLICPVRILFEEINGPGHKVVVALGRVTAGSICKRSIETDGCDWFDLHNLPWDTYHSQVRRIIRALKVLGRDDLAAKVTVQEKPKEKKILEAV